jgi:site-specific DNA-adenine methylase
VLGDANTDLVRMYRALVADVDAVIYADFRIDTVRCARSINSSADRRGDVNELIIVGQPAGSGILRA